MGVESGVLGEIIFYLSGEYSSALDQTQETLQRIEGSQGTGEVLRNRRQDYRIELREGIIDYAALFLGALRHHWLDSRLRLVADQLSATTKFNPIKDLPKEDREIQDAFEAKLFAINGGLVAVALDYEELKLSTMNGNSSETGALLEISPLELVLVGYKNK